MFFFSLTCRTKVFPSLSAGSAVKQRLNAQSGRKHGGKGRNGTTDNYDLSAGGPTDLGSNSGMGSTSSRTSNGGGGGGERVI